MRQAQLTWDLRVVKRQARGTASRSVHTLIGLLDNETQLAFHAVVPHGNVLKCISELLMRCAPHVAVTVDRTGMAFVACDPASGRLIHIVLGGGDFLDFRFLRQHPLRCTLESGSLHAVFHQLSHPLRLCEAATCPPTQGHRGPVCDGRRSVRIPRPRQPEACFGGLGVVDYSGQQHHTKHATISVYNPVQAIEYIIPSGYRTVGVAVPSSILQRILREYKNLW